MALIRATSQACDDVMSFQRLKQPIVDYNSPDRAQFVTSDSSFMSPLKRGKRSRPIQSSKKRKRASPAKRSKLKVVKGRVNVKLPGYSQAVKVAPSQLIEFVSKTNINKAAKEYIKRKSSLPMKKRRRTKKSRKR